MLWCFWWDMLCTIHIFPLTFSCHPGSRVMTSDGEPTHATSKELIKNLQVRIAAAAAYLIDTTNFRRARWRSQVASTAF